MLPKKKRLKRQDFNRFFSKGRKKQTKFFTLIHSPYPTFHASVVVSKKVEKGAVNRNKIRRRIYDIVRNYHKASGGSGVYIFIVKPELKKLTFTELKNEVITHIA